MPTSEQIVQRGAKNLDHVFGPDWPLLIDLEQFRLQDGSSCVIGQLFQPLMEQVRSASNDYYVYTNDPIPSEFRPGYHEASDGYSFGITALNNRNGFLDDAILNESWQWLCGFLGQEPKEGEVETETRKTWQELQTAWEWLIAARQARIKASFRYKVLTKLGRSPEKKVNVRINRLGAAAMADRSKEVLV